MLLALSPSHVIVFDGANSAKVPKYILGSSSLRVEITKRLSFIYSTRRVTMALRARLTGSARLSS